MHNPFDQLAKKVGKEALSASGRTTVQYEISRDAQHADIRHDPDPTRDAERARLGLLGSIATVLCLIEIFGHAPDGAEIRACLNKHFAHWEEYSRKAHAHNKKRKQKGLPPEAFVEPLLWILGATVSAPMLRKLEAQAVPGWPAGVYSFGGDLFRARIVVASELPRDRSTLLVRIMAAGPMLPDAITELSALPTDAHERTVAEQILLHLQRALGTKPSRTPEEEEVIVRIKGGFDDMRLEERIATRVHDVLTVLRVRGVVVPDAARERILAEKDPARLERWVERAAVAVSVAEVLDEPSRAA
jgi:hypothetical protein